MATAAEVIRGAQQFLGIFNELNPPDAFLEGEFFKELIRLINRWSSVNIDLGITISTVPADELENPASTDDALMSSLAIAGQKIAKVIAPASLRKDQKIYYRQMKSAFGLWPEQPFPASLPLGQGVNNGPRAKRFFPDTNTIGADSNTSLGT